MRRPTLCRWAFIFGGHAPGKKVVTSEAFGTSIYEGKRFQVDVGKYFARLEK
jgi:hypothetical protein